MIAYTILGLAFGFNFILLYSRNKSWIQGKRRWVPAISMAALGVLAFFTDILSFSETPRFLIGCLASPLAFTVLVDLTFRLSMAIQKRDIHLWVRHSDEIDGSTLSGGVHVTTFDRVFSIVLLLSALFLPIWLGILFSETVE